MIRDKNDRNNLSADEKIAAACRDVAEQVILRAERTGTPVVTWRNGQVVHLSAAEARREWEQKKLTDSQS